MEFILLAVGIFGLWAGTEITVRNAIALARRFNLSELFIGMTILAFGTDLPELVIAISGAIHTLQGTDASQMVVGNALGSSIGQISIVLGATAIFHFLSVGKVQIRYLAIELLGSLLLLTLVSFDNVITWNDGALLIIAFLIYFFARIQREKKEEKEERKDDQGNIKPFWRVVFLIAGLALVGFSSEFTINHALEIAKQFGIRQSFIGAIIIGLGSSLPELAISINAVVKKKPTLSVGNVIGSNIFDLLIPLGAGSLIADIRVGNNTLFFDLPVLLVASGAVLWFLSRKRGLQRWEGIGLIILYVGYAVVKYLFDL